MVLEFHELEYHGKLDFPKLEYPKLEYHGKLNFPKLEYPKSGRSPYISKIVVDCNIVCKKVLFVYFHHYI